MKDILRLLWMLIRLLAGVVIVIAGTRDLFCGDGWTLLYIFLALISCTDLKDMDPRRLFRST